MSSQHRHDMSTFMVTPPNNSANNLTLICESYYYGKFVLKDTQKYILFILDVVIMLLNVSFNSAVIYALISTHQLINISMKLILYLSISDFCIGVFIQPLFLAMLTDIFFKYENFDCHMDKAVYIVAVFLQHISGYIIALLGYDRYLRMKYLTQYSIFVKKWRLSSGMVGVLFLSFLQSVIHFLGLALRRSSEAGILSLLLDVTVLVSTYAVYILTVRIVRMHRKDSANRDTLCVVDNTISSVATKVLFGLTVCYIPYLLFIMVKSPFGDQDQLLNFILCVTYELTFANSFVNAFIFVTCNRRCRLKIYSFLHVTWLGDVRRSSSAQPITSKSLALLSMKYRKASCIPSL